MAEIFVAKASDMRNGDRRIVKSPRGEIGVFRHADAWYAYANQCIHSGGPACEGVLMQEVVDVIGPDRTYQGQTFSDRMHFVCPWHGYEYDLVTGEFTGDRSRKLKRYDVLQRDGDIFVRA
jgi:nitrite reductase/ring-hydroxylating ferredoxin subunit